MSDWQCPSASLLYLVTLLVLLPKCSCLHLLTAGLSAWRWCVGCPYGVQPDSCVRNFILCVCVCGGGVFLYKSVEFCDSILGFVPRSSNEGCFSNNLADRRNSMFRVSKYILQIFFLSLWMPHSRCRYKPLWSMSQWQTDASSSVFVLCLSCVWSYLSVRASVALSACTVLSHLGLSTNLSGLAIRYRHLLTLPVCTSHSGPSFNRPCLVALFFSRQFSVIWTDPASECVLWADSGTVRSHGSDLWLRQAEERPDTFDTAHHLSTQGLWNCRVF
jgi:hypothetical protein